MGGRDIGIRGGSDSAALRDEEEKLNGASCGEWETTSGVSSRNPGSEVALSSWDR